MRRPDRKIKGCGTTGIAGGADKVRMCRDEFRYDAAVDDKADDLEAALAAACPEGVRDSVRWVCQQLMKAEVSELIGAEHGERNPERLTHRNGYRPRPWQTRAGEIELAIRSSAAARTSRASSSRAAARSRRWRRWCRRRTASA